MSLAIDVDHVTHVLIAGTWHQIHDDSFTLDAYEYLWWENGPHARNQWGGDVDPVLLHGGGRNGICATGYSFRTIHENGEEHLICGPLDKIDAVRVRRPASTP